MIPSIKNTATRHNQGTVLRISGTIIDVQFAEEHVPDILNELHILIPANKEQEAKKATVEVAQQLGDGVVRCIAIENLFRVSRGLKVVDTGNPIQVPVGDQVLGRIFNVMGETIDGQAPISTDNNIGPFIARLPL